MYSEEYMDDFVKKVVERPECVQTHHIQNNHGVFCKRYYDLDPFNCVPENEDAKILNYYKTSFPHSSVRPVVVVRTINCYSPDETVKVYSIYDDKISVSTNFNLATMKLIREYPEIETPSGALIPERFVYLANIILVKK
jgi:hypothetical protein